MLIVLFILPVFRLNEYIYHLIILSLMFAIMALAWGLLAKAGPISLGHAAFFGLSAYFTYFSISNWGLSSYAALLISIIVSIVASLFLGYITFRFGVAGIYFSLVTIAFAEILRQLFISFRSITGGSLGVFLPVREFSMLYFIYDSKLPYYYFILLLYLISYLLVEFRSKKLIKILAVIGNDELTAASMGINVMRYKLIALILSSCLTAISGWFYMHYFRYITPDAGFGLLISVEIATIGIVGGLNPGGSLIAALVLIPLGEALRTIVGAQFAGLNILFFGLILMIVIILRSLRTRKR